MIKPGDKIPSGNFKVLGDGIEDVSTDTLFKGKKVVMFGVPGPFTPTCSQQHLPDYLAGTDDLKANGIDDVVCMAVADPFVMQAWGEQTGVQSKVKMMADGNAEITRAMGLDLDASALGMGTRCHRFSMLVDDGVVKSLHVEEDPTKMTVSACSVVGKDV